MLLKIVQPLLVICNQIGDVTGVRIVRLQIDAEPDYLLFSNAYASDKVKTYREGILYTSFARLKINKILKESIHTISLTDVQHDVNLRRLVCSRGEILKGACHIPIQAYDGKVAEAHLHAVIGSVDSGELLDIQRIYDYKGIAYTLDEFKAKETDIQLQLKRLTDRHVCHYDRNAPKSEKECCCCWMNSPACNCAMSWHNNRFVFALRFEPEVARFEASKAILQERDTQHTDITRSSTGYVYRVSSLGTKASVVVPPFCIKADIDTSDDISTWQLITHANMRHLNIQTTHLPQRADLRHLYTFDVEVRNGDIAAVLPKLMTSMPWGYGSSFILSAEDSRTTTSTIDLASWLYDSAIFNVTLGRIPWEGVQIPGAFNLSYTGTVITRSFMLVVQEPQKKYYFTYDDTATAVCTIGLGLDAMQTERILLNWKHTGYQHIAACFDNMELRAKQTQVVLNFEKAVTKYLHLDLTTEQITTVRAPYIEILEHYQRFLSAKRGDTYIYAPVNTLLICLNNASAYSDLYLYAGVKQVALVFMGDLALMNDAQRAQRLKQRFEEFGPRIHVPKGTVAKLSKIKDESIFAWVSTYYLALYPKQRYTTCTEKPLSNTLHTIETKLSILRNMFVEDL